MAAPGNTAFVEFAQTRSSAAEFTPDTGNLEVLIERMPAAALR